MYCTFFRLPWFHCDSGPSRLLPSCSSPGVVTISSADFVILRQAHEGVARISAARKHGGLSVSPPLCTTSFKATREAAALVPVIPYRPPPPPLHILLYGVLTLREENLQSLTHPNCPGAEGRSLAMDVRLARKPPALAMLAASYNERHLRRTG